MYNRFNALVDIGSAVYVLDHMAPRNARRRAGGAKVYGKRMKPKARPKASRVARPSGSRKVAPVKKGKSMMKKRAVKYVKDGMRKVSRQDPMKVSLKGEKGMNVTAWNSAYPGGVTHTTSMTLLMICLALVRFLFKQIGINFTNFHDPIQVLPGATTGSVQIRVTYKQDTGFSLSNTPQDSFAIQVNFNGQTFHSAAIALLQEFMIKGKQETAESHNRILWISIGSGPIVAGQTVVTPTRTFNCNDLYISVKGESTITAQNRTKGDIGETEVEFLSSNVYAQSLVGKYYQFNKNRPVMRNTGLVQGPNQLTYFAYDVESGLMDNVDRRGPVPPLPADNSLFPGPIRDALGKPPAGGFFENCYATKPVKLRPGALVTKRIEATETYSLTDWFYMFIPKWTAAITSGISEMNSYADPLSWKVGKSHCLGLELQCDTRLAFQDRITIGLEHNLFMVSKCVYRPKTHAVALVQIET